jgi:putative sterol carrier protein
MKVFALNSSPRTGGQSKTEIMLDALAAGMREAGAKVEVVNLRKKNVKNCIGCFSCWTRTPGTCIHKDDMTGELFPKWLDADLVVYASPLYHFTVNAAMKAFIERTLPILEPFFRRHNGRTHHPLRKEHPKVALLSVAGFPDDTVFEQLSCWVNFIYGGYHPNEGPLVAEIYRPMAEALTLPYFKEKAAAILAATRNAGHEIVTSGQVSKDTLARVRQPVVENPADFLEIGNLMWTNCIAEGITPKEFGERGRIPRPDSIESYIKLMKFGFNADAAKGLSAKIQFNFSGEKKGACFLAINDGTIDVRQGKVSEPNLSVSSPFEVWMDILTGKADGQQMFLDRKYTAEGDLELLMQMNQLFGGNP